MTQTLRILLTEGHRNTTGGNPAEIAITPLATRAIQRALQTAGHTADVLQDERDWFAGTLDAVAREVVRRHTARPYDLLLDIHFEGDANNTRGVFGIVPDGDGLRTVSPYQGTDSWESNPLDVRYASAIALGVAESTGLLLRRTGVRLPGVMSERQTGVGSKGYRLAMFGYTASVRQRLVRLVLELGNIQGDAKAISAPGFFDKAAAGVVLGIDRVLERSTSSTSVTPIRPGTPPFGYAVHLTEPAQVQVVSAALNARKWAQTSQPVMRVLHAGNTFQARGWIVGEEVNGNPLWWIMGNGTSSDLLWRVWSGGTNYSMEQVLALPTTEAA